MNIDCSGTAIDSNYSNIYDDLGEKYSREIIKQFNDENEELPRLVTIREVLHILLDVVLLLGEAISWFSIYMKKLKTLLRTIFSSS